MRGSALAVGIRKYCYSFCAGDVLVVDLYPSQRAPWLATWETACHPVEFQHMRGNLVGGRRVAVCAAKFQIA